jgi:hypothetical protein
MTSGKRSRRVVGFVGIVRGRVGLFDLGYLLDGHPYLIVFRGLRFESDAKITQKGAFFKGLKGKIRESLFNR